ncbi:golgin subfamily A member 7B-like isoform X2 [Phyllopteryx taeniolatus]|uniref:golgin subfamily A member 7B-like isoform X2 n=1 Tax=Phyllopteryx taeniolatus TaxID=161469 RepID=UPI002AD26F8D|nr:golgin subfamily A member 7B-like isoform X2 [Phyllopteryx taeniolatus]
MANRALGASPSTDKWIDDTHTHTHLHAHTSPRMHIPTHAHCSPRCIWAACAASLQHATTTQTRVVLLHRWTHPSASTLTVHRCNMATEFHSLQEMRRSASLVMKVFVQRDYSEGTVCRFQTKFPPELDNRIERNLLEETVKTLNSYYVEAEKIGGQSYLEGCLACATAYVIFLCMETRYEKVLRKITSYIQDQNEKIYAPRGLLITDPIERGMRVLEISVFEDRGSGSSSPSSGTSSTAGNAR